MSAEGDISVAEALQVLKKRALNDPSAPQAAAKVPKAQPAWEPPPLPPHRTGGQQQFHSGWRPPGGSGPRGGPVAVARPPGLTGAAAGVRPGMPVPGPKAGPPGPLGVAAGAVPAGPVAGTDGKPLAGNQAAFDIPQGKVGLLIGKQAATINAIKAICNVQCFVDQHTPDPDKARVTVVGATSETEKCKQIVLSLVSGSLTPAAVFQMSTSAPGAGAAAGALPLPGGAAGGATAGSAGTAPADLGKGQAPAAPAPSSLVPAGLASGPGALPTAGGGAGPPSLPDLLPGSLPGSTSQNALDALTASPANVGLAGAAAGLPTPALSAAAAGLTSAALPSAASLTGLAGGLSLPPSNLQPPIRTGPGMLTRGEAQVQQDINEYYAQWWQQYATTVIPRAGQAAAESNQEEAAANAKQGNEPAAFDREALARLAAQAAAASSSQAPAAAVPADLASSEPRAEVRGQQTDEADMELDEPAPRAQPPPSQMKELPLPKPVVAPPALPQPDLMPPISQLPPPTLQPPPAAPKPATPAPAPVPAVVAPKKEGFTGFGLTAAGPKILKDSDSVQKMLERLQGNVAQTKLPDSKLQPPVPVRVAPPGFDQTQANVTPANYTRAPADPELATLVQRIPDIKSSSEAEAFGSDAIARFPSFTAEQITDLLHKMDGITDLHTPEFLGELSKALTKRLNDFTSTQFSSLMSVFMLWSLDIGNSKRKSKVPARGPGSLPELCREFFVAAASEMSLRLMEFAPYELNCCLAAFVAIGFIEYKLFTSVGRAVLARHVSFGSQQLAALLTLLAELRLVHLDLLHSVGQFVAARAKEIRKLDALRVLRAFAKCNVRHDSLCQGIGNDIVERVREKGAESGWRVEDLCEVAWVFCVLQTYHEPLFRLMLKQLEQTPKVAADALCMLYECHLVLDSEHKEAYAKYRMEHETVQALLDHYKEHRKDSRRCSEHQRSDVANVLKSLVEGTVNVAHRTSIGLLVDVAALRKKSSSDGFIHIELDSPMTVVRPLDQDEAAAPSLIMEGPVALKRRLLQKHGLHLITVRESEWRDLGENRDKKRHLRSLLSSLSDILE